MRSVRFLILYALCINIFALYLMWSDKRRAKRLSYRIPEATLFAVALIGGSVGSLAGMYLFRHKTRKPLFCIGIPLILIIQVLCAVILYTSL